MARPNLHLVGQNPCSATTPDLIRGPAAFNPSELEPAEFAQVAAGDSEQEHEQLDRDPYIAAWMIAEGEQALRDRKAVRRLRWTIRAIFALSFVSAAWALSRLA